MAEKGKKTGIITWSIILVLALVFGFAYYFGFTPKTTGNVVQSPFIGGLESAYFEVFPANTTVTPEMNGSIKNIFYRGEEVFIEGTANISTKVNLTGKIFDSNGSDTGIMWKGNPITIQNGDFRFGPITLPKIPGNYIFKTYLNGLEDRRLGFYLF